jgi:hypothetical protein
MAQSVSVPAAGARGRSGLADLAARLVDSPGAWLIAAAAVITWIANATAGAAGLAFSADGMTNIGQILAPVALMSLFIERATEVVISSWRDPEAQRLQHSVDVATGDSQVFAQRALDFYRLHTQRLAFVLSFTLAVVTALVGFRVLGPLMNAASLKGLKDLAALAGAQHAPAGAATAAHQLLWFNRLDIVLAGLLMAGGADGIHQIVTTFTSFLESTRDRAASPAGGGAAAGGTQTQAPLPAAGVHQNLSVQANAQSQAATATATAPASAPDAFDDGV